MDFLTRRRALAGFAAVAFGPTLSTMPFSAVLAADAAPARF